MTLYSSDCVIRVLRAGHTTRDAALAASQRFAEDGTVVLGTVLNNWHPKVTAGYGYYSNTYYHYYHRHESHNPPQNDPKS